MEFLNPISRSVFHKTVTYDKIDGASKMHESNWWQWSNIDNCFLSCATKLLVNFSHRLMQTGELFYFLLVILHDNTIVVLTEQNSERNKMLRIKNQW